MISPALPGVRLPGSQVYIPLIIGWLALFIVMVVHEFSHGIVATAHNIKVKSSGIAFFGPIMGAFVEPDEKKLSASSDVVQYSVYAAGPFSNVLLAIAALAIMLLVMAPAINSITQPVGFSFDEATKGLPAAMVGIKSGMTFTYVNGIPVTNESLFVETMQASKPNDIITLETSSQKFEVTLAQNPDGSAKGYIGVKGIKTEYQLKPNYSRLTIPYWLLQKISELFWWVFVLSSGIGIINLLPLGPLDGGRMLQTSLVQVHGKKKGLGVWAKVSIFFLALLLLNIFLPFIMNWIRI
jgi:membrane-associated protease RseP (regulator of RpoE activity)